MPTQHTTLSLLIAARQLIADPANWTTKVYARAKDDTSRIPTERTACKFCALGAVHHAMGHVSYEGTTRSVTDALHLSARKMGAANVPELNDKQGHGRVLAMFDSAICSLEGTV